MAEVVSKKKQKALSFRKDKESRAAEKAEKAERKAQAQAEKEQQLAEKEQKSAEKKAKRKLDATQDAAEGADAGQNSTEGADGEEAPPAAKKRKTRRGKKGKGVNNGAGPRFILFIGNLPYDTTQAELETHFKNAQADRIRLRKEKGIAFLEFDNEGSKISSKMDHALAMHHSMFRNRKINVELTVGGGGNSEARAAKLKEKNDKLAEERRQRAKKVAAKKADKEADKEEADKPVGGMHPARAALLSSAKAGN